MRVDQFRILVVEDNEADVYLLRKALVNAGLAFELVVIEDGAEAIAYARREGYYQNAPRPDIIVLDLNLPKNGGTEVLEALRTNGHFGGVPVVVLTSSASLPDRLRMEKLGVDRFVMKPPDLADFLRIGSIV